LFGGILTGLLAATFLLEAPEPTRSVDEIMDNPEDFVGRNIAIRGEVVDGSIDEANYTFIIHGTASNLLIEHLQAAQTTGGLDDNRTVYAEGILIKSGDEWVFEAKVIKTSCPSKYEEANEE
jgi:hypothetical protein